jgi:hypothetical protein
LARAKRLPGPLALIITNFEAYVEALRLAGRIFCGGAVGIRAGPVK